MAVGAVLAGGCTVISTTPATLWPFWSSARYEKLPTPTKPASGVKRTFDHAGAALEHVDRAAADALAAGEREGVVVGVGRLGGERKVDRRLELASRR